MGLCKDMLIMHGKLCRGKTDFYVIGTGKNNSVEYFVKKCFQYVGLNYKKYVKIDKKLLDLQNKKFIADTLKARKDLDSNQKQI